jgi:D-alanyl-D-alanine carboxypeptidase (penicillin-binding protein 5/6)
LKKFIVFIIVLSLFTFSVSADEIKQPEITSAAYVLYNPDNNEVVESINGTKKMYPASLTKMMTALVTYENCKNLDGEVITVSENAIKSIYGTSSSKADLKIGEQVTVKQMLYLLMLPSGNDAANALAEHISGSNDEFAKLMNKKAKELGMNNSHFVNPHGLHNADHYTTAEDLAKLADAYSSVELLSEIAKCNQYMMPATNKQGERLFNTTNLLKVEKSGYYYPYANGLKTGNTDEAGRCLAASAEKDGVRYICILLNCPERWQGKTYLRCEFLEAAEVFKYAFEKYECVKVANKGTKVGTNGVFETYEKTADIALENDVYATLPKGADLSSIKIEYKLNDLNQDNLLLPNVEKGKILGGANIYLNGKLLGKTNVISANTVKAHWWLKFWHKIDFYVYLTLGIIGGIFVLFIALIIRKYIIINKRRKERLRRIERRKRMEAEFAASEPYNYFKM